MTSLLLLLVALTGQIPGSISIDPGLKWYTLETRHFDVNFACRGKPDDDTLVLPRAVAAIAEEVYATLAPAVGWSPAGRTQIVVADFYDFLNGWAAPFPSNTITIIPTPDGGGRVNDDDWLRTLILHEYTHILQTDMVTGVPRALRRVFGRVVLPNAVAPAWLNEGYAVLCETRFTDFGRLRSADFDMQVRAAADSGRLLPVDRCGNYELRRYPGGNAPYLYGSMVQRFAAKSEPDIWRDYNRRRSAAIPFIENFQARRTFGKSIYGLWDEWDLATARSAESLRASLGEPTSVRRLTHEGFYTSAPCWSSSGSSIYYASRTGREYPAIKAVDAATGETRTVYRGPIGGTLSLSRDGRWLAFAEQNVTDDYYEFDDLCLLDVSTGTLARLTRGLRARDPDFAPDSTLLVFVTNGRGGNALRLIDWRTREVTTLAAPDDRTAFHRPRFSPSGKWIAVGVQRPGGYADIELVDRRTGWTIPVTHDRANDISPCWSRTGRFLFFVSDRTGIYNLFAYQLATGETFQCTNVPYGVFEPAVAPDNRSIALVKHYASGDDIGVIDFRAADWRPAPEFTDTLPSLAYDDSAVATQLYYYSPFPALWPKFWLPWPGDGRGLGLGAFTLGWDALQVHQYSASAGWRFADATPAVSAAYTFRGLRPSISAALEADRHAQSLLVGSELELRRTSRSHWFDVSASAAHTKRTVTRFDAGWAFSNALAYRYCVAPVEGQQAGAGLALWSRTVLGGRDLVRPLAWYARYFGNAPQTWSLRAHVAAGTAFGDSTARTAWRIADQGITGVRGYGNAAAPGRTFVTAGLQYRMPLWWIERGIGTAPVFLQNLNGAAFLDAGVVSTGLLPAGPDLAGTRVGAGLELRADFVVFHLVPVSVAGGAGLGLNPVVSCRGYVNIESDIVSGIFNSADPDRRSRRRMPTP